VGLLGPTDTPPVEVVNENGSAQILIICDHASNAVPLKLNKLGLDDETLLKHIGWDIGAAKIARGLSFSLDATAVLTGFSRLVIDANRQLEQPTSIPEIIDGITIPGNQTLSKADRSLRTKEMFCSYHRKISDSITRLRDKGAPPALFSVHTFTPSLNGNDRPWHIGVLWNRDPRIAEPLISQLRQNPNKLVVGDNLPYSGSQFAYSLDFHAGASGLPNCAVEIRQDLADTDHKVAYWVNILTGALNKTICYPDIHRVKHY